MNKTSIYLSMNTLINNCFSKNEGNENINKKIFRT